MTTRAIGLADSAVFKAHWAAAWALVAMVEATVAMRRDAEALLERAGEALLAVVARGEGDLDDAFVRLQELAEGVGQAAAADIGLERLVGERLEDALEVPAADPRPTRHLGELDVLVEVLLDEVDAALHLHGIVLDRHHHALSPVW